MYFAKSHNYVLLAACLSLYKGNATPIDAPVEGPCFDNGPSYSVTSTETNQIGSPVVGDYSCVGTSGCSGQAGNEFSVSVEVSVGVDLGLDVEAISAEAGISAAVSISTETGNTQGVQINCPTGPWTCALIIYPPVTIVSGIQSKVDAYCIPIPSEEKPYTASFPEKTVNGELVGARVDVCACQNFAHWADKGAPSTPCPHPCVA